METTTRVVILFMHGAGLHKGTWTPILRRLRALGVSCDFEAIDLRYHGTNASDDEPATLFYERNDKNHPRVAHPMSHSPEWASDHVRATLAKLKRDDKKLSRTTRVIGVGHSLGATVLIRVEVATPGTFDGLMLFEPALSFEAKMYGGMTGLTSTLISMTLMREDTWNTREEALVYMKKSYMYRNWHPECFEAFLDGGLVQSPDGKSVRLATPLLQASAIFCHEIDDYTREQLQCVRCPVVFEYGSNTSVLNVFGMFEMVDATSENITVDEALPGLTHMMLLEDPDLCAQRIFTQLKEFTVFRAHHPATSRL